MASVSNTKAASLDMILIIFDEMEGNDIDRIYSIW